MPNETLNPEDMVSGRASEADAAETARNRAAVATADRGDFTLPARHSYDPSQVQVIRQTVAKDCNDAEFAMFLEVAARYGLDPFAREIFAAKFDGSNGGVTIFAGRDGMLKVAKQARGPHRFKRLVSAVVREKDTYEVETAMDADTGEERIQKLTHRYSGMGSAARGAIVGAWAMVWREGDEAPWFAEASWEDYGEKKQQTRNGKDTNWTIGKGHPEAMMIKVPESIVLRKAFGMAGLYGQEEVPLEARSGQPEVASGSAPTVDWGEGWLAEDLRELVLVANSLVPNSWRDTKVAMRINGRSEEERLKVREQLIRFVAARDRSGVVDRILERQRAREGVVDGTATEVKDEAPAAAQEPQEPEMVAARDWLIARLPEDVCGSKYLDRALSAVEGEPTSDRLLQAVIGMVRQQEERENHVGAAPPEDGMEAAVAAEEADEPDDEVARAHDAEATVVDDDADLPFGETPEYDRELHERVANQVADLRAALEDAADQDEDVDTAALRAQLREAEDRLAAYNEAAEAAGAERIEL